MLETIREFGLERLAASGEEFPTRSSHAAWGLALAEQAIAAVTGPAQAEWLDRLDAERPNLRAALEWLETSGQAEEALRLATALANVWSYRGHFGEGRVRLGRLLTGTTLARRCGPRRSRRRVSWQNCSEISTRR